MKDKRIYNKIMLIDPPGKVFVYPDGTPASRKHCSPPIGLAYIAANLLQHDYEVEIIDMNVEGYEQEVYKEPFIIYGLSNDDMVERVRQFNPDIIGISVLFSMLIDQVNELCQALKDGYPEKPIILGGQHASGAPLEVMDKPYIDYVLQGESDLTFIEFLEALNGKQLLSNVKRLYYKQNGKIENTMNNIKPVEAGNYKLKDTGIPREIDKLPYPAWHLLPIEKYWNIDVRTGGGDSVGYRYAVMLTTRGCPNACYYCTSPLTSGFRGYRKRSVESVINEIRWLIDTYNVDEIQFVEDNFYAARTRNKQLLKALAKEFSGILFWCTSGAEANALDKEMIDLMAEANFNKIILAVESGDVEVQAAKIDKKVDISRLPETVEYLKSKNIDMRALFMMGFPGETRAQIMKTVDLVKNLGVLDFNLNIVTAFPGTPLYDECIEKGLFHEKSDYNSLTFSRSNFKVPDITPEELESIRRTVWLESFKKKMESKKASTTTAKKVWTSAEEYQTYGFNIKPPTRKK